MDFNHPLNINFAISAFKNGDFQGATNVCLNLLEQNNQNHGANYILALIASQTNKVEKAKTYFERAINLAPDYSNYRIALSTHYLNIQDFKSAISELETVISKDPSSVAAHTNIATAFKKLGNLPKAVKHFDTACTIFRAPSCGRVSEIKDQNDSLKSTFFWSRKSKIEHDIEQFKFLYKTYPHKELFNDYANRLSQALETFMGRNESNKLGPFSEDEIIKIEKFYNKLIFRPEVNFDGQLLGAQKINRSITKEFGDMSKDVMVVDDFLSDKGLLDLQRYCLEATVWFDNKNESGYLGAYLHDGFVPPITLGIVDELKKKWATLFSNRNLKQLWAFKYDSKSVGTTMHADDASININLWITPDESCKNLENSGLKLYPVAVPKDASFSDYNNDQNQLNRFISGEKEKKQLEVPYRCNRAVIFKSRIIHQTSEYEFYSGYENRRVNITFLFD